MSTQKKDSQFGLSGVGYRNLPGEAVLVSGQLPVFLSLNRWGAKGRKVKPCGEVKTLASSQSMG